MQACNNCYIEWFIHATTCPWCRAPQTLEYLEEIGVVKAYHDHMLHKYTNALEEIRITNFEYNYEVLHTRFVQIRGPGLLKEYDFVFDLAMTCKLFSKIC